MSTMEVGALTLLDFVNYVEASDEVHMVVLMLLLFV